MTEPIRVAQVMGHMMGGGVEATIMNHYRHIDRSRVQFDFIVDDDSTAVPRAEIESLGGHVHVVPAYRKLSAYLKTLRVLFAEQKPDIVHSNINSLSVFPLSAAKRAGVPVRIAHSHSTANPGEHLKTAMKMVLRPFSRVYPTDYVACSIVAARWLFGDELVDAGRVHYMKNAIEVERFVFNDRIRAAKRDELGVDATQPVIGQVGRMCFQKNQLYTLDIFAEVLKRRPDAVLVFVGDGDMMPKVRERIHALGIERSVRVLGLRNDVNEWYQAFDLLALPSKYEGLAMVAVEAQAAGLPVVATDSITHEAGIVSGLMRFVPLDKKAEWVNAFTAADPAASRFNERDAICRAGYDIKDSVAKLCDWYEDCVRRHHRDDQ